MKLLKPRSWPSRSAVRRGADAEIIEQVLVKVNGDIITKTDLERVRSPPCGTG